MDDDFIQLKWNTHHTAFLDNLSNLRDKQVFTDVTLSCGDHFYPAHRLVLSSCSTFLARALQITSGPAPVLLLHGIMQDTLEHILMFMYDGQVTIARNELPMLLKAAHWLGVKGLDDTYSNFGGSSYDSASEAGSSGQQTGSSQAAEVADRPLVDTVIDDDEDGDNTSPSKGEDAESKRSSTESSALVQPDAEVKVESMQGSTDIQGSEGADGLMNVPCWTLDSSDNENSFEGWEGNSNTPKVKNNMEVFNSDCKRSLKCKHCKRSFTIRAELAKHIRISHDFTENYCFNCNEKFFTEEDFRFHMQIHCNDKWHYCKKCDYIGNSDKMLTKHMESHEDDIPATTTGTPVVPVKRGRGRPRKFHNIENMSNSVKKVTLSASKVKRVSNSASSQKKARVSPKVLNIDLPMPEVVVKLEHLPIVRCMTCFMAFKNRKDLLVHRQSQTCYRITKVGDTYHCPLCEFSSKWKQGVTDHLGKHTGRYAFQCSYCKYQCRRPNVLQHHIQKNHREHI